MIAIGSIGVISVVANAFPAKFSEMVRLALVENYPAARIIHYQFVDIIGSLFEEGSPSGVKAYLSEMGVCGNHFRMPVYKVSEKLHGKIKALMQTV
jgi:4-hydroxy-tetrahydrodipicolinate synthase